MMRTISVRHGRARHGLQIRASLGQIRIISMMALLLFAFGCGSRKVNKSESIEVIEQQSVKEVKSDLELSVKDSFVSQFVNKNSRFKADNVKVNVDGSIDIVNPVVEVVESLASMAGVRDSVVKDKGSSVAVESVKASSEVRDKKVSREEFFFGGWLIPLGVLVGVGWLVWRWYK